MIYICLNPTNIEDRLTGKIVILVQAEIQIITKNGSLDKTVCNHIDMTSRKQSQIHHIEKD